MAIGVTIWHIPLVVMPQFGSNPIEALATRAVQAIATPPLGTVTMISRSSPQAAVDHNSAAAAGAVLAARDLSSGVVLTPIPPRRWSAYATS
jgi:hypothetical protein